MIPNPKEKYKKSLINIPSTMIFNKKFFILLINNVYII